MLPPLGNAAFGAGNVMTRDWYKTATREAEHDMDFNIPTQVRELQAATRRFIAQQVMPLENDARQSSHGPDEALRQEVVSRARAAGLLTPHASLEIGGLGLSHVARRWCSRRPATLGSAPLP